MEEEIVDLEQLEKQAERNAAWGVFAAIGRMQQYDQKIDDFDRRIENARGAAERNAIEAEKKKFVDDAKRDNRVYVGGLP